jgi:hypothetical protein
VRDERRRIRSTRSERRDVSNVRVHGREPLVQSGLVSTLPAKPQPETAWC